MFRREHVTARMTCHALAAPRRVPDTSRRSMPSRRFSSSCYRHAGRRSCVLVRANACARVGERQRSAPPCRRQRKCGNGWGVVTSTSTSSSMIGSVERRRATSISAAMWPSCPQARVWNPQVPGPPAGRPPQSTQRTARHVPPLHVTLYFAPTVRQTSRASKIMLAESGLSLNITTVFLADGMDTKLVFPP
jgi:hypothetical protein